MSQPKLLSLLVFSLAPALAPALTACGDDSNSGRKEDTAADVLDVLDTVFDVISFDTEAVQPETTETTPPTDTGAPDTSRPDTSEPDTAAPEITEGCRTFGCRCSSNGDCLDELCIESADGNICTRTCIADCPANFDCLGVTSFGTDPISVCVPRHTRLCRPCRLDAECDDPGDPYPAYCLADPADEPAGATGSFCGSSCANRDCPEGYACEDVALSGGGSAKQCVPTSGECACRPAWGELGYSTDCAVTNVFGSCEGTKSCTPNGLSACIGQQATQEICDNVDNDCDGTTDNLVATACFVQNINGQCPGFLACQDGAPRCQGQEPLAESCNGVDDNCNAMTDELTCNDNLACTTDTCASPNQCQNALIAGSCLVNGACFQTGQFNPLNVCEVCDPAKATAAFSQSANTCVINGQCYPANATNPENACQICQPSSDANGWSTASNTCQIGGACYAANQANPSNACEICSPVSSTTSWTQALNTCNIQGACYAAGVRDPNNECVVCDPTRSATGWSNAGATIACDDHNACSATSTCNGAGACVGDTTCNDGVSCTVDTCNPSTGCTNSAIAAGSCRIGGTCYSDNTANPTNPCQRCAPGTSQSAWSPQPTSVGCNDGAFCTTDDHCNGSGGCTGTARTCGDAYTCTADSCNEGSDVCVNTLQGGNCLISGTCYANNTTQPGNVCYRCNSGGSTSSWSLNNGATCNDANTCTSSDVCNGGSCGGSPIPDVSEPNNSAGTAKKLADVNDCTDPGANSITGTIYPVGDNDWYSFVDKDDAGCSIYPDVQLTNIPPNSNLDLEVFFACANNTTPVSFECDVGTRIAGQYGCRSNAGGTNTERVTIDACCTEDPVFGTDCAGTDSGNISVRVYKASGADPTCEQPYTLKWGDN